MYLRSYDRCFSKIVIGSEKREHFTQIPNFGFEMLYNFEAVIATDLKLTMNILTSFGYTH